MENKNLYNDVNKQQGVENQQNNNLSNDKSSYGQTGEGTQTYPNSSTGNNMGNNMSNNDSGMKDISGEKKEDWKQEKPYGQGGCEKKTQPTTDTISGNEPRQ